MSETQESKCSICNNPQNDHPFRHPFTPEGVEMVLPEGQVRSKGKQKSEEARVRAQTAATVARMGAAVGASTRSIVRLAGLLVEKGVITVEEMTTVLMGRADEDNAADSGSGPADGAAGSSSDAGGGLRDPAAEGRSTPESVDSGDAEQEPNSAR